MYVKKTYRLGRDYIDISKYYPGNYGAPNCSRKPKRDRSPEAMQKVNESNRVRRVQRLILANFKEGDLHLILTYKKEERPENMDEAKKRLRKFMNGMRNDYKKLGIPFKWICVTEIGKLGACHHHLIIENHPDTMRLLQKHWKWGRKNITPLYDEGAFVDLAEYIVKKETKEEVDGCSYSRSRNLVVPKAKKEKIRSRTWNEIPKPPKGWFIVPGSLINGFNPVTEYPYQRYMLQRLGDDG